MIPPQKPIQSGGHVCHACAALFNFGKPTDPPDEMSDPAINR